MFIDCVLMNGRGGGGGGGGGGANDHAMHFD